MLGLNGFDICRKIIETSEVPGYLPSSENHGRGRAFWGLKPDATIHHQTVFPKDAVCKSLALLSRARDRAG